MKTTTQLKFAKVMVSLLFAVAFTAGYFCFSPLIYGQQAPATRVAGTLAPTTGPAEPRTKSNTDLPSKRYGLPMDEKLFVLNVEPPNPKSLVPKVPNQVGINRPLKTSLNTSGKTFVNHDGSRFVMLAIKSPGAVAMRAHFDKFELGVGDELFVYGRSDDSTVWGPYVGKGLWNTGELWSGIVEGDTLIIEYFSKGQPGTVSINEIGHLVAAFSEEVPDGCPMAPPAPCHIDASCFSDLERDAVANIVFAGAHGPETCTGTLLTDRSHSRQPFFLTANHCINTQSQAQSIVAYWRYRSTFCNSGVVGNFVKTQGANLLAHDSNNDYSFLYGPPAPSGAAFAGWDPNPIALNRSVFGLHHPRGSYLRRSIGNVSGTNQSCSASGLIGGFNILWTSGATEPGSSGSGLFVTDGIDNHLVGVDSCGPCEPNCSTTNFASYSKFSSFFSQIQPWLDPTPTPSPTPTRIISLSGNLAFGNVAVGSSAQRPLTVSNTGNSALTVSSISYPNGFSGSFSGTIPAGGSQNVTVTFAPTAVTTYGGLVTVNANQTSGTNTTSASGTGTTIVPTPTPTAGPVNCDTQPGIIIHDDGSIENGYSGNPATIATFSAVDKFTPSTFPSAMSSVCVAFITTGGTPTTLNYSVILYDDDGPAGAPGTELGAIPDVAIGIPGGMAAPVWQSTNISSLGISVNSGSVYIGVRYTPSSPNVFVAADQSTTNPAGFAGGYLRFDPTGGGGAWETTQTFFPDYRSLFVRAVAAPTGGNPTPTPPVGGSLVVSNVNSQGAGSLANAIATANSNPAPKTISFNLPGNGPWTITVSSPLLVTAPVTIDGPLNRVYVEGAPGVANIFELRNHSGTTIKGLGIYYYDSTGVLIDNANGVQIENCYVGFKQTSGGVLLNRTQAPFSTGISIRGSYNQVHRSTISGVYDGIVVGEPSGVTGFISADNLFEGNNIGTDPTGQFTIGYENSSNGISLRAGAKSSWIGGWTSPEPSGFNVIAGNGGSGILIGHPTADHNRVFSNYLGLNRGGTAVIIGNTNQQGILIENGAQYNAAWSNFISANRSAGITVASSNNWILGNIIGLNQPLTQALGGQPYGILLKIDTVNTPGVTPRGNAIGGSDPNPPYYSYGNVICNQSLNGVQIENGVSNGVMCNWIGVNYAGQPFPNGGWGVYLLNSSFNSDYGCHNAWGPNGFGLVGGSGGGGNSIQ